MKNYFIFSFLLLLAIILLESCLSIHRSKIYFTQNSKKNYVCLLEKKGKYQIMVKINSFLDGLKYIEGASVYFHNHSHFSETKDSIFLYYTDKHIDRDSITQIHYSLQDSSKSIVVDIELNHDPPCIVPWIVPFPDSNSLFFKSNHYDSSFSLMSGNRRIILKKEDSLFAILRKYNTVYKIFDTITLRVADTIKLEIRRYPDESLIYACVGFSKNDFQIIESLNGIQYFIQRKRFVNKKSHADSSYYLFKNNNFYHYNY